MATTTRLTVSEYLDRFADDPRRTELVDGEVVVIEPRATHAEIQATLLAALVVWSRRGGAHTVFAPTAVHMSDHDLYGPDVVVARKGAPRTDRDWLAEVPLLCAEIRSPSTWRHDIGRKRATYEANGLPELWLVDGFSSTVLVFRRSRPAHPVFDVALELGRAETLTSPDLPGFALPIEELFPAAS